MAEHPEESSTIELNEPNKNNYHYDNYIQLVSKGDRLTSIWQT